MDVGGGSAAQDGLVSSWKMFKDLLEVFYRLQAGLWVPLIYSTMCQRDHLST